MERSAVVPPPARLTRMESLAFGMSEAVIVIWALVLKILIAKRNKNSIDFFI
jgi:hypothetical protein